MQLKKPIAQAANGLAIVIAGVPQAWTCMTYSCTRSAAQIAHFVDAVSVGLNRFGLG